ncbi:peptidoglycan-binding protein [Streptomyces sp. C10-9-1]|uniref:peptidoglycan-binding domain-containing protein n=1 Tax=Streptomyces sp. C10-9-1 TaxID=1859285 RepID=UPI002111F155|nr:peptidoglycan-binding domain-containing protein [Streptomyces sp. C10-9-1]MCQ6553607.1 peptidoglycan-binding protein [Streptomyces sp. C10-9-1]
MPGPATDPGRPTPPYGRGPQAQHPEAPLPTGPAYAPGGTPAHGPGPSGEHGAPHAPAPPGPYAPDTYGHTPGGPGAYGTALPAYGARGGPGEDAAGAGVYADGPGDFDTQELPPLVGPAPGGRSRAAAPRRRRRGAVMAAAAAIAVAGTAAYASGLFQGSEERDRVSMPDRDTAQPSLDVAPDLPSASVPPDISPSASPSATSSASASATSSASATAPASPSLSPSASATRSVPVAGTPSAPPSTARPTVQATGSVQEPEAPNGTLRLGDTGAAVVELQVRLQRVWLYPRDWEADGVYDQQVEYAVKVYQWDNGLTKDGLGVYGPRTRRALEAETGQL